MRSRELVTMVLAGDEPGKIPLHLETLDKEFEARFSDLILGYAWVPQWSVFLDEKGPFSRETGQSIFEWADELELESYEWPEIGQVVQASLKEFEAAVLKYVREKFVVFEVIGPTEQCEYMCAPKQLSVSTGVKLSFHRFDFSSLTRLNPGKARTLYNRVSKYVLELIKAGLEIQWVDAVRVADDAFSYAGPNYRPEFFEKFYLPWHKRFTEKIRKSGRHSILHSDGDLTKNNLLVKLSSLYDAIHPLDLTVKSTLRDAEKWVDLIVEARGLVGGKTVFMTGLPIDLFFRDEISPEDFISVPKKLLSLHGRGKLVLSNTHRPYPGRSFSEGKALRKILKLKRFINSESKGIN